MIDLLLILALHIPRAPEASVSAPVHRAGLRRDASRGTDRPTAHTAPDPQEAPAPDPAVAAFETSVGLLLVPVKPDRAEDYEAAILALQEGFQKSSDAARREMASGWRVYKASEVDAKNNVLYVHALWPVVAGVDYRPSLLLDELLEGAPAELMTKYRDALAGPPSKLSLTELAHMGTAPIKKEP